MFTGIVTAVGTVTAVAERDGDRRLSIDAPEFPWQEFAIGDSIAVNGACLTAVALRASGFDADVSTETLSVTTLGGLQRGSRVNLELAVALGQRLGGHLVSGHIDAVGEISGCASDARAVRLTVRVPAAVSRYLASKGSVCIDGVSLTVNEVSGDTFGVAIIPHTLDATILGGYRSGTAVNIEVDLLARYIERLLSARNDDAGLRNDSEEH